MTNQPVLDERQQRVFDALQDRSVNLAGIYIAALAAIAQPAAAGRESARVSVICHCARELMNGLPSVMTVSSIPRPKPSSDALKSQLPDLLAKRPDLDLRLDQDFIPVPREVARTFGDLVAATTQEKGRNRRIAAELVTGGMDITHPVVSQWLRAQSFFLGWTHLDRNHESTRVMPTDEHLLANLRVVEDVIEVRTALFFDNVRSIEDLLNEANAADEGSEE